MISAPPSASSSYHGIPTDLLSEELGLLRSLAAGQIVLVAGDLGGAATVALARDDSRVCALWEHGAEGSLGQYLADLRRCHLEILSDHRQRGNHDEQRLWSDAWSSDRQTRVRGTYTRSSVCVHIGPIDWLLVDPMYDATIYTLAVVIGTEAARRLRLVAQRMRPEGHSQIVYRGPPTRLPPGWIVTGRTGECLILAR